MTDPPGPERDSGYPVPSGRHRVVGEVRRSRFLTTLARAADPDGAHTVIRAVQEEFPDATHHCWAFVAGPPGDTGHIGMSDAGEPHGTAGRPMLTALLHSGVGEIVAVVTRYFGGVKLGTGGLSRAYSGQVVSALESLPTAARVDRVRVRIDVPFAAMDSLYRLLDELDARDREESYGSGLELSTRLPRKEVEGLREAVADFTSGRGRVEFEQDGAGVEPPREHG